MSDTSRLDPDKDFPEDLTLIDRDDLDILNSRNHRARDLQYIRDGEVGAETDGQHHELREELDRRQTIRDASAHTSTKTEPATDANTDASTNANVSADVDAEEDAEVREA